MAKKAHKINNIFWIAFWLFTTIMSCTFFGAVSVVSVVTAIIMYSVMEWALWFVIHNAIDEWNEFRR